MLPSKLYATRIRSVIRPPNMTLTASIDELSYPLMPIPPNMFLLYARISNSVWIVARSYFNNAEGNIFQLSSI